MWVTLKQPGYLLLHCLLYIGLATMLSLCVTKFVAKMIIEYSRAGSMMSARYRLTMAQNLLERIFWKLPPEQTNWLVRKPNELVWKRSTQEVHEGVSYQENKIWYTKGIYDQPHAKWVNATKRTIAYGIDQCSWKIFTFRPIKKQTARISSVETVLRAESPSKLSSKKISVTFRTPLGAYIVYG